jgi:hypothetical protein
MEEQQQRDDISDDDDAKKFKGTCDGRPQGHGRAGRVGGIVAIFDHLCHIVQKEAGDQCGNRRKQQRQCKRETDAGANGNDEPEPTCPVRHCRKEACDPRKYEGQEQAAQRQPQREQHQQRQSQHLPEDRARFRCKQIGSRQAGSLKDH